MKFATFFTGGTTPGTARAGKALVVDANKAIDTLDITTPKVGGTTVVATGAELNAVADNSTRIVDAGATLAVTVALHDKKIIGLDQLAGSVCTLPQALAATIGARFRFRVKVLATSNSHIIKVGHADDTMQGAILIVDTDTAGAVLGFAAGATADTITLNRSTTGSVSLGEEVEVECVAVGKWQVRGVLTATGDPATPFSATV